MKLTNKVLDDIFRKSAHSPVAGKMLGTAHRVHFRSEDADGSDEGQGNERL